MSKDTSGPAFPNLGVKDGYGNVVGAQKGMTLRDYFAGQALPSVITALQYSEPRGGETWNQMVAREVYAAADAMIEARK
jgi:hypothetical protein